MLAHSGATHLSIDRAVSGQLAGVFAQIAACHIALDEGAEGTQFADWLPSADARPELVAIDPD